jgi:hypothetical protein
MNLSDISKQGRRLLLSSLLAAATIVGLQHSAHAGGISPGGAAIVGGVAGLAVGAAIADAARPKKPHYYKGYQPAYPPGQYDPYWYQVYRPDPNVSCYPAQRLCYNRYGAISDTWTRRVYGY